MSESMVTRVAKAIQTKLDFEFAERGGLSAEEMADMAARTAILQLTDEIDKQHARNCCDRLAAELRKPFLGVFLDGRNEHGSHVIAGSQTSISGELERDAIELLADQSAGVAEDIIKAAEAAGYEIGMCVAVTWRLDKYHHDNGEIETVVAEPTFSEPLTIAFYGSADEQRRAALEEGKQ